MIERMNSGGFDLSEVSQNEWIFNVRGGNVYVGTFKEVVTYAVKKWGFQVNDIEYAVKTMIENDHDTIHFGLFRTMIYTLNREDRKKTA